MTTSQARGIKQDGLNDTTVAEYLQTYPDFFERNSPSNLQRNIAGSEGRDGISVFYTGERIFGALSLTLTKADIAQTFQEKLGTPPTDSAEELTMIARANQLIAAEHYEEASTLLEPMALPAYGARTSQMRASGFCGIVIKIR